MKTIIHTKFETGININGIVGGGSYTTDIIYDNIDYIPLLRDEVDKITDQLDHLLITDSAFLTTMSKRHVVITHCNGLGADFTASAETFDHLVALLVFDLLAANNCFLPNKLVLHTRNISIAINVKDYNKCNVVYTMTSED
jgi:hypothetical protein